MSAAAAEEWAATEPRYPPRSFLIYLGEECPRSGKSARARSEKCPTLIKANPRRISGIIADTKTCGFVVQIGCSNAENEGVSDIYIINPTLKLHECVVTLKTIPTRTKLHHWPRVCITGGDNKICLRAVPFVAFTSSAFLPTLVPKIGCCEQSSFWRRGQRNNYFRLRGVRNKRLTGLWFEVIRGGYGDMSHPDTSQRWKPTKKISWVLCGGQRLVWFFL